jgi:hypothetical protein
VKALKKAIALSNGFLAGTVDKRRRIIELANVSESDSEANEIPTGANKP